MTDQNRRRPMPWYPGPKLGPFSFPEGSPEPRIKFLQHVGYGAHSDVFRVDVAGETYALKVFKFQRWNELVNPSFLDYLSVRDIYAQYDPFHCECRAYGRLQETGQEHLALRCYGYIILSAEEEESISKRLDISWNRSPLNRRQGLRAILKEYVSPSHHVDPDRLKEMRQDLIGLHHVGIVVWDLREGNYLNSKISDFSQARVVPHYELVFTEHQFNVRQACWSDLMGFDGVVEEIDPRHPDMFFPSPIYARQLRNPKTNRIRSTATGMDERFLVAARYDWKKAKKVAKTKPTTSTQPATVAKGRVSKATQKTAKKTKKRR